MVENGNCLDHLEVILKTVERCNIRCSYCYFFQGDDKSYKSHPPFISWEMIQTLTRFLIDGIRQLRIKSIQIDLHGREPTLQKKSSFDQMCHHFRNELGPLVELSLALQTNATLIDEEWIDLFSKHNVSIGVSIDGPQEVNDRFRIDYKGRGTYHRTIAGLRQLQNASKEKKIGLVAALCVINPKNNGLELYHHLVHELDVHHLDFLLPDYTHHNFTNENPEEYGKFLCDLLDGWVADDNPLIRIRILNSALRLLVGGETCLKGFGPTSEAMAAITVASNGNLSPDDSLRSGIPHLMNRSHISSISLREFFDSSAMKEVVHASKKSPKECRSCCWDNVCGGNILISRYSRSNGFNNPSVFCAGLKMFYAAVARYLIQHGVVPDQIRQILLRSRP